MRSIHTTNQKDYKKDNNTPYRVIHQHRTKLGNPIWGIIILAISIISLPLLSAFTIYADSNVSFSVNNNDTVLELTIPESINLDLTPSSANNYISFGTVDLNILAGTNNLSGYTLTMKADSDTLARTSSITDGNGVTIAPIISPLSLVGSSVGYSLEDYRSSTYNNYTLNTWGYKKSTSTNFIPMPVTDIELASTDAPGNATPTTLNFAAKVDSSIPAGIYNTTLNFNIVGNPNPITDLTDTTWYFADIVDNIQTSFSYSINFTSDANALQCGEIYTHNMQGPGFISYYLSYRTSFGNRAYVINNESGPDGWQDEGYRTIHITGGADATSPELIEWIQANATLVN